MLAPQTPPLHHPPYTVTPHKVRSPDKAVEPDVVLALGSATVQPAAEVIITPLWVADAAEPQGNMQM